MSVSDTAESAESVVTDADLEQEVHDHPGDLEYVKIFVILAVLTGIEVFTYFESVHSMSDAAVIASLVVLMVVKFALVVLWFMHLKFDSAIFGRLFVFGLILAIAVYVVMLLTFQYWMD